MASAPPPDLYYIHGLDSSPQGFRAVFFKENFPEIKIPKLPNDVETRLDILRSLVTKPACLVGSSLGGLTSLLFARDCPEKVLGMVLIAPAVATFDPEFWTPESRKEVESLVLSQSIPTHLIAARNDEIIPLEAIRDLHTKAEAPLEIPFEIFEDTHLLHSKEALEAQLRAISAISEKALAKKAEALKP